MTAKRTETDVQNFPPRAAILASLFAWPNDWELPFQVWKSSSMREIWRENFKRDNARKNGFTKKNYNTYLIRVKVGIVCRVSIVKFLDFL